MKKPKVSVVVPGKNSEKTISKCIEPLMNQSYPNVEVIYVDNNSQDKTKEIASKYPVKVLSEIREGSFIARNNGARNASGEVLVFTDSDCIAEKDWVENLVKPILEEQEISSIGKIISAEGSTWSAIEQQTFEDLIKEVEKGGYASRAYTGNLAIKKTVFDGLGGFDENIIWNADTDFSVRLVKAGYKIKYVPEAKVKHFHRTSLTKIFMRKFQQGYWANYIYKKNKGEPHEYGRMIKEIKKSFMLLLLSLSSLALTFPLHDKTPAYVFATLFFACSVYEFTCPTNIVYITKKRPFKQKIYQLTYFIGWRLGILCSLISRNS